MARGVRTTTIDNNGPAASVGTITITNAFGFFTESFTLHDGTNTDTYTFGNLGGGSTDKSTIDIGGGPDAAGIAARIVTSVMLARTAGDINITATSDGAVVTFTNDSNGANNTAIVHNLPASAATVTGMGGGSDDVGVARFTAIDVTDVNHGNHAQAYFTQLVLENNTGQAIKYGYDLTADPTQALGPWNTLANGETVTLDYKVEERVQQLAVNAANAIGLEYSYSYEIV